MKTQSKQPLSLKIYDTAERRKRLFEPLSPSKVKLYCCGPTVYDYLHIGNFRGAVFFNFVRNWIEMSGWPVDFIYNFTDIDDKILNRAKKEGVLPKDLAEKYIKEFKKDYQALKLKAHSANPQATQTLPEIIHFIEKLLERGAAYQVEGDVFFSVSSFKGYGALSGKNPDELLAGVRIEPDHRKKDPLDFALWKSAREGETWSFESPWGKGRPGWHIECSAMIHKFLGDEIDIHAGGSDLIFPHHENERAQSCSVTQKGFVRFWLHNNMIVTKGDKMAKSKGNIIKMRDFLQKYPGECFKFLILSCHYRSPLQFSPKTTRQALVSLVRIYSALAKANSLLKECGTNSLRDNTKKPPARHDQSADFLSNMTAFYEKKREQQDGAFPPQLSVETARFHKSLKETGAGLRAAFDDDFASPRAFALLFGLVHAFQKHVVESKMPLKEKAYCAQSFLDLFQICGTALSLFQEEPKAFLKDLDNRLLKEKGLAVTKINSLLEERALARAQKNFKTADRIRRQLESLGVDLSDSPSGTKWKLKK